MHLSKDVDLEKVANALPRNFTGADFSALTSDAYMIAVKRRIVEVQNEIEIFKTSTPSLSEADELLPETFFQLTLKDSERLEDKCRVFITQEDFMQALSNITPSISMAELLKYEDVRKKYSSISKSEIR